MARITAWLALLFLLFAFTMKLECAISSGVFDTDNSPVQDGGDYYILPIFAGEGGGITLASIGVRHPLAVVQFPAENFLGLPVTISNPDGTMIIQTDGNLTIKFTNIPDSSTWMVVMDDSANVWYVGIGNAQDYPSDKIQMGSFQIKNYDSGYKLVFCSDNTSDCEDVGIYTDKDGNSRLALYGAAFAIKFKNADKDLVAYE